MPEARKSNPIQQFRDSLDRKELQRNPERRSSAPHQLEFKEKSLDRRSSFSSNNSKSSKNSRNKERKSSLSDNKPHPRSQSYTSQPSQSKMLEEPVNGVVSYAWPLLSSLQNSFAFGNESVSTMQSHDDSSVPMTDHKGDTFKSKLVHVRDRPRWQIHDSVLDVIGQTPIVRLNHIVPTDAGVNVFVKCENLNPGGSLKDRLAYGIIEWAEHTGQLQPGQTVIEASSGNTGIGLAMVCAAKGYKFVCVMSESFSIERRKLMRYLGAQVVLTKAARKATGMLLKAQSLADKHGYFYAQQFENEANAWIHEQTTGPEIVNAFNERGIKLDHLFMAYGTGGTCLGVSRHLRQHSPNTCLHLCEPRAAPMIHSGIPTSYPKRSDPNYNDYPTTSFERTHPVWNPHIFQGWATDFIPKLADKALKEKGFQYLEHVVGKEAIRVSQKLAIEEGLFVGISSGGILAAALAFAEDAEPGTNILAILTDTGERYLSTTLFDDIIGDGMTEEEQKLCDSTPDLAPRSAPITSGLLPAGTDDLFDM